MSTDVRNLNYVSNSIKFLFSSKLFVNVTLYVKLNMNEQV